MNNEDNSELEIIEKIQTFLKKVNLDTKLKGICILTIGIDKSSLSGCFVFNYDKKILLKHYPGRYNSDNPIYIKINNINYTIQFDYNLPILNENGKLIFSIPNLGLILDSGQSPNSVLHFEHTYFFNSCFMESILNRIGV